MNHRKTILGLLTILVTLFLCALALETVSFFIVKALPEHPSRWEFRAAKPLAYANSPYYSTQFLDESRRAEGVGKFDEHVRRLDNYEGRYIKIRNNHRRTTDAPIAAKSAVYVFGGSTVFSGEVPDTLTIPSFLQRELNKFTDRYFVINAGIPSMNSNQQLFYLLATPLNIGDIVVFFDGVNDAFIIFIMDIRRAWLRIHLFFGNIRVTLSIKCFRLSKNAAFRTLPTCYYL